MILAQIGTTPLDILWWEIVVLKTDTARMRQSAILSSAFVQLDGLLYLYSGWLNGRNEQADPANAITWKSPVSRGPSIAIPGSQQILEIEFSCV